MSRDGDELRLHHRPLRPRADYQTGMFRAFGIVSTDLEAGERFLAGGAQSQR